MEPKLRRSLPCACFTGLFALFGKKFEIGTPWLEGAADLRVVGFVMLFLVDFFVGLSGSMERLQQRLQHKLHLGRHVGNVVGAEAGDIRQAANH